MLMEALDVLGPDDVLVLDRGYPAAWLVALLNERGIRFVTRCDNDSGLECHQGIPALGRARGLGDAEGAYCRRRA